MGQDAQSNRTGKIPAGMLCVKMEILCSTYAAKSSTHAASQAPQGDVANSWEMWQIKRSLPWVFAAVLLQRPGWATVPPQLQQQGCGLLLWSAGYSLSVYIPMSFACIFPIESLRWSLVAAATLTSGLFLLLNFRKPIFAVAGAKYALQSPPPPPIPPHLRAVLVAQLSLTHLC